MLRMAKRYGCKYPDVFLAVLFAVLIVSMTGYCSFAYAEDSGADLSRHKKRWMSLRQELMLNPFTPIKKMAKRKEQSSKVNHALHIRAHTQLIKEPFL